MMRSALRLSPGAEVAQALRCILCARRPTQERVATDTKQGLHDTLENPEGYRNPVLENPRQELARALDEKGLHLSTVQFPANQTD